MQFIALCVHKGWLITMINQWKGGLIRINSFVITSTVAVKCSHCGHGEAGQALLEKGMLKTSLEWPSQGLGWQSTGIEGCCRRSAASTVHAEQCKQSRLAFLLSWAACTQLHLLPLHTLIQLGLITPIVNAGWLSKGAYIPMRLIRVNNSELIKNHCKRAVNISYFWWANQRRKSTRSMHRNHYFESLYLGSNFWK